MRAFNLIKRAMSRRDIRLSQPDVSLELRNGLAKRAIARPLPDFCSAETLAHRLDCSKTTIHGYVRRGLLPKPIRIGELVRWRWTDVETFIESLTDRGDSHADANDPYFDGIDRGSEEEGDDHAPALRSVREV